MNRFLSMRLTPATLTFIFAIWVHLEWGILLIIDERAAFVTGIAPTRDFVGSSQVLGIIFILVAVVALFGIQWFDMLAKGHMSEKWRFRIKLVLLVPQQFMLLLSAGGAISAMASSAFADGVIRPQAFIVADQSPIALIAILHTVAIWVAIARRRSLWEG